MYKPHIKTASWIGTACVLICPSPDLQHHLKKYIFVKMYLKNCALGVHEKYYFFLLQVYKQKC